MRDMSKNMFDTYFKDTREGALEQLRLGEVPSRYVDFICRRFEISVHDLLSYMMNREHHTRNLCDIILHVPFYSQIEVDNIVELIRTQCLDSDISDVIFVKLLKDKYDFNVNDFIDTTFLPPNEMVPHPSNTGMTLENWNNVFENLKRTGDYETLYRVVTTMTVMPEHQDKLDLLSKTRNWLTLTKHSYIEDTPLF